MGAVVGLAKREVLGLLGLRGVGLLGLGVRGVRGVKLPSRLLANGVEAGAVCMLADVICACQSIDEWKSSGFLRGLPGLRGLLGFRGDGVALPDSDFPLDL